VSGRKSRSKPKTEEEVVVKPEEIVVDYTPTQRRNLKEAIGKTIVIYGVDFREGRRGSFAVVDAVVEETGEETQFYTFSRPVVDELRRLLPLFEEGKRLRTNICVNEKKGYLYLCTPPRREGK
jgi:hypothetical protein